MLAAVNLGLYLGAFVVIIVLCVLGALLFDPPKRRCHHCGARVRIGNRRCPRCGYEFLGD